MSAFKHSLFALFLLTCFAGLIHKCPGQSTFKLDALTLNEGLSQGYVNCLLQDREGFIWMGTINGLNRYDGRQFKVFTPKPFDTTSIAADWVRSIYEYENYLVLGFAKGGINIFDKRTGHAHQLWSKNDSAHILEKSSVHQCYVDKRGNLYARSDALGLNGCLLKIKILQGWPSRFNQRKIEVTYEVLAAIDSESQVCFASHEGREEIWYPDGHYLNCVVLETGEMKAFKMPAALSGDNLNDLRITPDRMIWIATDHYISRFKDNHWELTRANFPERLFLEPGDKGRILITSEGHIYFFKASYFQKNVLNLAEAELDIALPRGGAIDILHDKSGIIWAGTNGYGVVRYNPRLQRFRHYFPGESANRPILIETTGNISFTQANSRFFSIAQHSVIKSLTHRHRVVDCLYTDPGGAYWAVARDDYKTALFKGNANGDWKEMARYNLEKNTTVTFKPDRQGNLWMANSGQFFKYDPITEQQVVFDYSAKIEKDHKVFDFVQTSNGHWWIATNKGLIRAVQKESGFDFQLFKVVPSDKNSLQSNQITCLLPDPENPDRLWIGTAGGGLNCLHLPTMKFSHLTTANGLPNDVIYGILADDNGVFWLSSNKGLIRYYPSSGSIRNYTVADGLPSNEFNSWAFAKAPDGTLYFGCVEGLIAFHPAEFVDNPVKPEVRITGLKINNQKVIYGDASGILSESLEYSHEIILPFAQNSVSLELAALEYSVSAENRFKYYLKGAEPEWVHESKEHVASYLNLPPGNYTFFARACNSDGVWSETITSLQITILPPWYRTNLAYSLYGLLLLLSIYSIFRFFLYRQQLKHKLVLEQKEAERQKELNDFRTRLYTNITHEFRTPLTVIQGMAEEVMQVDETTPLAKLKRAGNMIRRNGADLLRLVNQILDLARAEANALKLHLVYADLIGYCKYLTGSYESAAAASHIGLYFYSGVEKLPMMMDKERLQTILSNFLSNALKFTPEHGYIEVRIQHSGDWQKLLPPHHFLCLTPSGKKHCEWISITVKDNGAGISPSQLPYIFDRFYQASANEVGAPFQKDVSSQPPAPSLLRDADSLGTGIGLALVKELIQLMQGALAVSSHPGAGTTFVVVLPVITPPGITQETQQFANNTGPSEIFMPEKQAISDAEQIIELKPGLPTVLLIEDNADVMEYVTSCVKDAYRVLTAQNGQQGIDKAFEVIPDLIVSDVMMPIKDGFEVVQTLKNDKRTRHIPIIILTALAEEANKLQALRMGVDDYLTKPFSQKELRARADNLVANYQQRQVFKAKSIRIDFESTPSADQAWLEAIEILCLKAIDKQIDLSAGYLADQMALSERQLLRRLNVLTGLSTKQYVQEVKLQKARHQLEHKTYNTISEIAYASGFNTPNYFTKVFLQRFGKRPSDYLNSMEEPPGKH